MKTILITGVSSGLGFAMAKHLCKEGHQVIGSIRNESSNTKLRDLFGAQFIPVNFDVTREDEIVSVRDALVTQGIDSIDILINNAGIAVVGPLEEMDINELRKQLDVNVIGLIAVTNAFIPLLKKAKKAKIINIGSVSGIMTNPFLGAYCMSKYAVESASDAYRIELKHWGIDVVCLQPGPIKSLIWNKSLDQLDRYNSGNYQSFVPAAKKLVQETEKKAFEVTKITSLIDRIISGKAKKARYLIHKQALVISLIQKWMPDRWMDSIIYRQMLKHKQA